MTVYHGRARISARHPQAVAICDRCGFMWNNVDLRYQREWAGPEMITLPWKVCQTCYDEPCNGKRTISIPADPVPVKDPRPEDYTTAETDWRTTETGDRRATEDDSWRTVMEDGDDALGDLHG